MVDVRTNLLKNRQTLSEKDYQKERKVLRGAIVALVVTVVIAVSLSIWNLMLTRELGGIEKSITATSKEMQGLTQASAQQIYLKSRLKLVTDFLHDRSITREALQKVLSTNIPGTHISGLDFESEYAMGVQYIADDSSALSALLDYYEGDTDYFIQSVSRGLTKSRDGSYQLSLSLSLPQGDK